MTLLLSLVNSRGLSRSCTADNQSVHGGLSNVTCEPSTPVSLLSTDERHSSYIHVQFVPWLRTGAMHCCAVSVVMPSCDRGDTSFVL